MRILFLSSWFPYPPDNGSRIRIFNLVRELGRRHEVTLLSFTNHERDRDHVAEMARYCAGVRVVVGREFRPQSWRSLAGLFLAVAALAGGRAQPRNGGAGSRDAGATAVRRRGGLSDQDVALPAGHRRRADGVGRARDRDPAGRYPPGRERPRRPARAVALAQAGALSPPCAARRPGRLHRSLGARTGQPPGPEARLRQIGRWCPTASTWPTTPATIRRPPRNDWCSPAP